MTSILGLNLTHQATTSVSIINHSEILGINLSSFGNNGRKKERGKKLYTVISLKVRCTRKIGRIGLFRIVLNVILTKSTMFLRKEWNRNIEHKHIAETCDISLVCVDKTPPRRVGVALKPSSIPLFLLFLPLSSSQRGKTETSGWSLSFSRLSTLVDASNPSGRQTAIVICKACASTSSFFSAFYRENVMVLVARRRRLLFICGVFPADLFPLLPRHETSTRIVCHGGRSMHVMLFHSVARIMTCIRVVRSQTITVRPQM